MEMNAKKRRETYRMEYTVEELSRKENTDYGKEYRPKRDVKVIKKDGTKEAF